MNYKENSKELDEKQENLKSEIETQLKEQTKDDLDKEKESAIKNYKKILIIRELKMKKK